MTPIRQPRTMKDSQMCDRLGRWDQGETRGPPPTLAQTTCQPRVYTTIREGRGLDRKLLEMLLSVTSHGISHGDLLPCVHWLEVSLQSTAD